MKTVIRCAFSLAVVLGLAVAIQAGSHEKTVTLTGTLACAKCALHAADAKGCQDVLMVDDEKDSPATQYYLVKNDVAEKFGHACSGKKPAMVTGTVTEKDGKMWLTATKIESTEG